MPLRLVSHYKRYKTIALYFAIIRTFTESFRENLEAEYITFHLEELGENNISRVYALTEYAQSKNHATNP